MSLAVKIQSQKLKKNFNKSCQNMQSIDSYTNYWQLVKLYLLHLYQIKKHQKYPINFLSIIFDINYRDSIHAYKL